MARDMKHILKLIDSITEELSVEQSFLNDLERAIELEEASSDYVPSKTYKPSSMNCMRQNYYTITGIDPEKEERSYTNIGICNSGSDIHERIQTAVANMKKFDMDCEYVDVAEFVNLRHLDYLEIKGKQGVETKLYHKNLNMSFLCDGIIKYRKKYYILELKTETANKFWKRTGVDKGHYNQATAYSLALGIENVLFVYISRDMLEMKSFMLNVTDSMRNDLMSYIETCNQYIADKKVPPANYDKKTCGYCKYRQQCRKDN